MAYLWARSALVLLAMAAPIGVVSAFGQGCNHGVAIDDAGTGGAPPKPTPTVLHPHAPPLPVQSECKVEITTNIPLDPAVHIPICEAMEYPTNPPSGGDHWGKWAAYGTYDIPVPREMYVHD